MPKNSVLSLPVSETLQRATLAGVLSVLFSAAAFAQSAATSKDVWGDGAYATTPNGGATAAGGWSAQPTLSAEIPAPNQQGAASWQPSADGVNDLDAGGAYTRQTAQSLSAQQTPQQTPQQNRLGAIASEPSQFQNFVRQATGKLLPVYGHTLFANPTAYQADSAAPVADGHLVAPGDQIKLQTWGGISYTGTLTVDRNGQVSIPSVGAVSVGGLRAADVGNVLRKHIGKTYSNFEISTSMGRLRGIPVYVVGQAQRPGTHTVASTSSLINALFASGGPSVHGSMRNIQLKRNGQVIAQLDLYDFISKGDKRSDVALKSGDTIVIAPVGPRVAITGVFDHEAIYELKPDGSSLGDILGLNGGTSVLANTSKVQLQRIEGANGAPLKVETLALDQQGLQHRLQDGDIVTLLGISPAFANAVTLQGNVAEPLRYRWFEGMRIRDLIPEPSALITKSYHLRKNLLVQSLGSDDSLVNANLQQNQKKHSGDLQEHANTAQGLPLPPVDAHKAGKTIDERVRSMVDEVNWDYAVIERLDKTNLRTELIPFNLGQAVLHGDETQNLQLQAGDVVTILSQKDLKLPEERQTRMVRVEGEVAAPGLYQLQPGETLNQLLMRIGGVTPQAYLYGIQLQRESVRQTQQQNLDLLIRRIEQQQQSQMLYLLANNMGGDKSAQAAIMEQQQKMAQTQIAALRKLQSSGRIALELDPSKNTVLTSLPDLPLEDKDSILVPRTPAFISVAGAVNNENVVIYKPGRTVKDVIKVAGLREEADDDQMFVLRADGSIVSNNNAGWLSGVNGIELMPGDTIVVPEKLDRESTRSFVMRQLKDVTQIVSQLGLGVAAIKAIND